MHKLVNGGLPIGSLFGIPLRVHWSFLALLVVLLPMMNGSTLLLFEALFISVLVHEFGHCFASRSVGGEAKGILLWPLGGLAFTAGDDRDPLSRLWVVLAGPLTHIPMAGICAALLIRMGYPVGWEHLNPLTGFTFPDGTWAGLLYSVMKMQTLLFAFNLCLPAYPMDGGQMVVGICSLFLPLEATVTLVAFTTAGVAFMLYTWGYVLIAVWMGYEALGLFAAALSPRMDWHPIGRLYTSRPSILKQQTGGVYLAPGLELIPCPECGKELHPRSRKCVHCETVFPETDPTRT